MNKQHLIQAIRDHAMENYNESGWDYVIECWSDEEILQDIDDAMTVAEAIKRIGTICMLLDERRQEVLAEIF